MPATDINRVPPRKETMDDRLHEAIIARDGERIMALLDEPVDLAARDSNGWTALHFAAQERLYGVARYLLARGAPVDAKDPDGNTPLSTALYFCENDLRLPRLLLAYGADPDLSNKHGQSPRGLAQIVANADLLRAFDGLPERPGAPVLALIDEAREHVIESDKDSWYAEREQTLATLDEVAQQYRSGNSAWRSGLSLLFAPTGDLQELALSNGWSDEYLGLSKVADLYVATST